MLDPILQYRILQCGSRLDLISSLKYSLIPKDTQEFIWDKVQMYITLDLTLCPLRSMGEGLRPYCIAEESASQDFQKPNSESLFHIENIHAFDISMLWLDFIFNYYSKSILGWSEFHYFQFPASSFQLSMLHCIFNIQEQIKKINWVMDHEEA